MRVETRRDEDTFDPALAFASALVACRQQGTAAPCPPHADVCVGVPDLLDRHGLSGMVAGLLPSISGLPSAARDEISANAHRHAARALRGLAELTQVISALERTGVPAVSLKGPLFSQWLYGSAGIRRIFDLDVLVRPDDRQRAYAALQQIGYELPAGMSPAAAAAVYGSLGAWPLARPGALSIDLHWRVAQARFPAPLTPAQIIDESVPVVVGRAAVRIPAPTHAALLTLMHAAKHVWGTLESVAAIGELTRRADVEWGRVRSMAERAHGWTGCAAGLRLATEILGSSNPLVDVPWPLGTDGLCTEGRTALRLPRGVFPDRWAERRAHRTSFDRWPDRLLYDISRLFAPTPFEWQRRPLPAALTSLYIPLRVLRIARGGLRGRLDEPADYSATRATRPADPPGSARSASARAPGRHRSNV